MHKKCEILYNVRGVSNESVERNRICLQQQSHNRWQSLYVLGRRVFAALFSGSHGCLLSISDVWLLVSFYYRRQLDSVSDVWDRRLLLSTGIHSMLSNTILHFVYSVFGDTTCQRREKPEEISIPYELVYVLTFH